MYVDTDEEFECTEWFNTELGTEHEKPPLEHVTAKLKALSGLTSSNYVIALDEAGRLDDYNPKNGVQHWRAIRRACCDVRRATSINFCC
eukprot:3899372-Rhodomonas_salina.1